MRVSEAHGQCCNRALPGQQFCNLHACPQCGTVKASGAALCVPCESAGAPHTLPPGVPPSNTSSSPRRSSGASHQGPRCVHTTDGKGQCNSPAEPGKAFCARHEPPPDSGFGRATSVLLDAWQQAKHKLAIPDHFGAAKDGAE